MNDYMTLNDVINEELKNSPEFKNAYQEELLINKVSQMIVEARREANLTQAQLAVKANTSQPVIARLESGRDSRIPSLALLSRIARALNAKLNISFVH